MNKVFVNASWMTITGVAQTLISFVVSILTVRYLGPSNYGLINYAFSLVSIISPMAKLGLDSVMVSEIINKPEEEGETVGTIIGLTLCSSILSYVLLMAFVLLANPGETLTLIVCLLYAISIILDAIWMLIYWVQAKLLTKETSIITIVICAIMAAYKVFLLATSKSVYWFAVTQPLETLLLSSYLFFFYKKNSKYSMTFSLNRSKELLAISKYYIFSSMMVTLFSNMDRIMIKGMITDEANGYYGAALTIVTLSFFVFDALFKSFKPQILEYKLSNNELYENSLTTLYSLTFYLSLLQAIFFLVFSKYIILILYGEQYLNSVSILKILGFSMIFNYLGVVRNIWVLSEEKHKHIPFINAISAIINIVLNYILIKEYGVIGAAIATLATYFISNVIVGFIYKPVKENNVYLLRGMNPIKTFQVLELLFSQMRGKQ